MARYFAPQGGTVEAITSTTESLASVSISRPINLLCPTTPTTLLTKISRPVLLKQPKRHSLVKSKRFDAHLTRYSRMVRPNPSVHPTSYSRLGLLPLTGELQHSAMEVEL